jgi:hypothetical protein
MTRPRGDEMFTGDGIVRSLVVESGLQNDEVIPVYKVDQPVFLGDPSRPSAGQHV